MNAAKLPQRRAQQLKAAGGFSLASGMNVAAPLPSLQEELIREHVPQRRKAIVSVLLPCSEKGRQQAWYGRKENAVCIPEAKEKT